MTDSNKNLICLCSRCVSFYINNPDYFLKRISPFAGDISSCDRCGYYRGYDYIITPNTNKSEEIL